MKNTRIFEQPIEIERNFFDFSKNGKSFPPIKTVSQKIVLLVSLYREAGFRVCFSAVGNQLLFLRQLSFARIFTSTYVSLNGSWLFSCHRENRVPNWYRADFCAGELVKIIAKPA
jgi:hypothetical protein